MAREYTRELGGDHAAADGKEGGALIVGLADEGELGFGRRITREVGTD